MKEQKFLQIWKSQVKQSKEKEQKQFYWSNLLIIFKQQFNKSLRNEMAMALLITLKIRNFLRQLEDSLDIQSKKIKDQKLGIHIQIVQNTQTTIRTLLNSREKQLSFMSYQFRLT
eukprot:403344956